MQIAQIEANGMEMRPLRKSRDITRCAPDFVAAFRQHLRRGETNAGTRAGNEYAFHGMPGSARVSRVGDGVLAVADFLKACFGETPKPTRETRVLPRVVEGHAPGFFDGVGEVIGPSGLSLNGDNGATPRRK